MKINGESLFQAWPFSAKLDTGGLFCDFLIEIRQQESGNECSDRLCTSGPPIIRPETDSLGRERSLSAPSTYR